MTTRRNVGCIKFRRKTKKETGMIVKGGRGRQPCTVDMCLSILSGKSLSNLPTAVLVVRRGGAGLRELQATTPHSDLGIVFAGQHNNPALLCFVHRNYVAGAPESL
jgi:hypothetical protein